jgi:two-component system, LytTR family, response regulator
MINSLIVDDEPTGARILKTQLAMYCPTVNVIGMAHSADDAQKKITEFSPNLLFLDVEMPNGDGFDLLGRLENIRFEVIFTTAHNEYALKAIKHNALDYLLKPIGPDELMAAVKKCEKKLALGSTSNLNIKSLLSAIGVPQKIRRISVPTLNEILYIEADNIIRMEADSNYTQIFLTDKKKLTSSKTLKDYENALENQNFFRIHKTHLVNLSHIRKFIKTDGGCVLLSDGTSLEVARRKKDELLAILSTI